MIASLKKNWKGMVLMLISALTLAVGSFLWKVADLSDIGTAIKSIPGIWSVFLKVLPGFVVYVIGAVVMTVALGLGELSVLQPMNCMSYVFALILSAVFLTETITPVTLIGIFVIVVGVFMIGGSGK
ncbi:MAG: triose-phosphate transporter family protein [Lachnospiraceae bacterium]|nr:triose-phosphate transporter family protein [Lachnospiraceae bacterium]